MSKNRTKLAQNKPDRKFKKKKSTESFKKYFQEFIKFALMKFFIGFRFQRRGRTFILELLL